MDKQKNTSKYRLRVTKKGYIQAARRNIFILFVSGTFLSISTLLFLGKNFESLIVASFIEFVFLITTVYLFKKIRSASIKDGFLLMKTASKVSKVTSLRSIKNLKTKTILGIQITKLRYNLDGGNHTGVIINTANSKHSSPEALIKKELFAYEEKKKANHKPGPVAIT